MPRAKESKLDQWKAWGVRLGVVAAVLSIGGMLISLGMCPSYSKAESDDKFESKEHAQGVYKNVDQRLESLQQGQQMILRHLIQEDKHE